jgi:hypothetical protein
MGTKKEVSKMKKGSTYKKLAHRRSKAERKGYYATKTRRALKGGF